VTKNFTILVEQMSPESQARSQALAETYRAQIEADKQKKLTQDLKRQLREEIGDDETLLNALQTKTPNERLLALQHKFGLSTLPIKHSPVREFKETSL
jgi:hypothetical protein